MFLIDTNIISELRKKERANEGVRQWFEGRVSGSLFLSVLTIGELTYGVERVRGRDPAQAASLGVWLESLRRDYRNRILRVDARIAQEWGRIRARASSLPPGSSQPPDVDSLLAATALAHDLTVVTRNVRHFQDTGAKLLNPFS